MSSDPVYGGRFWAVEDAEARPLARGSRVLAFSTYELADSARERAHLAGARVQCYAGEYEMHKFFEKAIHLGATHIVVDEGHRNSQSVAIHPQRWDWAKFERSRARAAGLEIA